VLLLLLDVQDTLNNLFYKCVETLKQDHPIRIVNAIQVGIVEFERWYESLGGAVVQCGRCNCYQEMNGLIPGTATQ